MTSYFMKIENEKQKIETCSEEKDLGITFDSNLNFDTHKNNIAKKANQMLGVIRRTFTFMSKKYFFQIIQGNGKVTLGVWKCGLVPIS